MHEFLFLVCSVQSEGYSISDAAINVRSQGDREETGDGSLSPNNGDREPSPVS